MTIDFGTVQRVKTHAATLSGRFDEVVAAFCAQTGRSRPMSRRERFEFADAVAAVVKSLGTEQAPAVAATRLSGHLPAPATIGSVVASMRTVSGESWTAQMESDWTSALRGVLPSDAAERANLRRAA